MLFHALGTGLPETLRSCEALARDRQLIDLPNTYPGDPQLPTVFRTYTKKSFYKTPEGICIFGFGCRLGS